MPMPPIEFYVSMFRDERDQARSQYVLLFLMEALCRVNQSLIVNQRGRGQPLPLLYASGIHYEREPPGQEHWPDIEHLLRTFDGPGQYPGPWGDCVPASSAVLRGDFQLVPIASLVPGDKVMAEGKWATVTEHAFTGEKPILSFALNNGSVLRCTPNHRVFLADGKEVRAESVKPGDKLLTPREPIPTGEAWTHEGLSETDLAWMLGVYAAYGWNDFPRHPRFAISGRDPREDGQPRAKRDKTDQKKRVQAICETAGIDTRWHEKYVAVNDRRLAALMASCGGTAPVKALPRLSMTTEQVAAVLEGLRADAAVASSGTVTHGTVSPVLALQLRVLYRMLGQSTHIRRWDDHGGLGTHPIYRVTVRRKGEDLETKSDVRPSAKVLGVREEPSEMCVDITTSTGSFWLPESDVIVHNCEDLACYRVAELRESEAHRLPDGKVVRGGVKARPFAKWRRGSQGQFNYHALVLRPDGRIEDPSLVLGMRKEAQFAEDDTAAKLKAGLVKPVIQFADPPDVMVVDPDAPSGFRTRNDAKGLVGVKHMRDMPVVAPVSDDAPNAGDYEDHGERRDESEQAPTVSTDGDARTRELERAVVGAREALQKDLARKVGAPRGIVTLDEAQAKVREGTLGSYGMLNLDF